ncbi:MAG: CpsD/CapB family tyrosine-protein kinase [Acutalibacteraceae bacterium]
MFNGKKKKQLHFTAADNKKLFQKNMDFTVSEQYKLLRTNLSFTLPDDVKCPIIGVTSSIRGEGKSTTAVNLSYALAQSGKKVLLIDADLRLPSIAKKMKIDNTKGLSNLLFNYDTQQLEEYKSQYLDNWYIVPSGELPPNPSELLGSRKMGRLLNRLSESFDYIVIDFPPVNIVSDALAASKHITGMILVVREDYTEKKELEVCVRQLKLSDVNVLGSLFNGAKSGKKSYGKYKKYYNSYYSRA